MKGLLTMVLFFVTMICCMDKPKNVEFKIVNNKFKVSEFNISELNIVSYDLKAENISGIFTDIAVKDTLLICGNLYDPKLLNIYSLSNKKLLNQVIKRGTSSNEGLSASNFYSQNEYVWVYDITLGKLFKTDLIRGLKDSVFVPQKEISFKGLLKNMIAPQIISDSLILATSYSVDDCRYFYSDGNKILRKTGKLPQVMNDKKLANTANNKIPNKANIFKAFSIKNSTENKIAVFYNKTDRMEFYINDKLYKIWNSTKSFNPVMQVKKLNNGYTVQDSEKTKYAYLSIASDEHNIYALYAGSGGYNTYSNTILVFDWSGNILNKISLDRKVSKIALEPTTRTLFCYDYQSQGIFSTRLLLKK